MIKRDGFVLAESVVSLFIMLLVATTLTICLGEEYKQINLWEQRISAHKLMLINLNSKQTVSEQTVKNQKYFYDRNENSLKIQSNGEVFQVGW
ncbi:hypothetical protein [Companilactobacillus keshanensis]|uniref:Type II secretion system protein n=1 Tax=Companilactobacillus keshanensis TaxID=2486003 RepID=A0ABW4BTS4_9LACO|nr:hypothetical protein [Companilactobacillus keshanensis]